MITKDEIRALVSAASGMELTSDFTDDTELSIDSLTLLNLQYLLEERHELLIEPSVEDMHLFTSVNRIHKYLLASFPDQIGDGSS